VAGFRDAGHNASADFLRRWVSDNTFIWLISEEIVDEYKEVLARHKVRHELICRIIKLLREEASLVAVKRNERVLPDLMKLPRSRVLRLIITDPHIPIWITSG